MTRRPAFRSAGTAAIMLILIAQADVVHAQGMRGTAVTTARYFELRPIGRDTVAFAAVEQRPNGTYLYEGLPISCIAQLHCIRYRALDKQSAVMLTQDVGMTAWGLGMEGLSATVQLRARAGLGGDLQWPRSDDPFDAILAYAELLRGDFRFRAGRLQSMSGLGFTSFDGGEVLFTPTRRWSMQVFGGRSLARGVYEPRHEALEGVERFFPDRNALLIGAQAAGEPWAHTNVTARYQREIWTNRSALVSERASLDVRSGVLAPVQLSAGMDYDFAFGRIDKSNLNVRLPVPDHGVVLELAGSRYVPYFELWTIWGYFSPVAHHEIEARAAWRIIPALQVHGAVGYRKYDDTGAQIIFEPLADDAVSVTAAASWTSSPRLTVDGSYRMERGFGAYLGSGDVAARYRVHERATVTLDVSAFQQIEQFRLGDGVVLGGGGSADVDITSSARLSAGAHIYRQTWDNRAGDTDWNQVRGWAALRIGFGHDPGIAARGDR
ncbi:MAG: hypothetical protein KFH98_02770 [Gemmatimonadetes bacterium]|nr:hypothetical protein [Gemmatimonadota bacterium]